MRRCKCRLVLKKQAVEVGHGRPLKASSVANLQQGLSHSSDTEAEVGKGIVRHALDTWQSFRFHEGCVHTWSCSFSHARQHQRSCNASNRVQAIEKISPRRLGLVESLPRAASQRGLKPSPRLRQVRGSKLVSAASSHRSQPCEQEVEAGARRDLVLHIDPAETCACSLHTSTTNMPPGFD